MGRPNLSSREFDERIMDLFSHYFMMLGALGERAFTSPGAQYGKYEAAIGTGQAIFRFDV